MHRGTITNYITARIPAKNSNGIHGLTRSKAKKQDWAPAVADCRGLSTLFWQMRTLPTHKVVLEIGAGHLKTQMLSEGFPEVVRWSPRRSRPTSSFRNTDATS